MYEQHAESEQGPDAAAVMDLFERAGAELSAAVKRTLAEAQEFHSAVVENRRDYLRDEITALRRDAANDDAELQRLSERRATLMEILDTKHALEDFTRLNERLAGRRAELAEIESQISRITEVEERQAALEISGQTLVRDTRRELADREQAWSEAIALFASNTEALYGTPGELLIDLNDNGFSFDVNCRAPGSDRTLD